MHSPSLILTILPLLSLSTAAGAEFPSLSLENIKFSSYYLMVSPSAQGPRQGVVDFTMINSAVEVPITCSAKNSNAFAIFSPSITYECVFAPAGEEEEEEERDENWCWTNSATFNFDTTTLDVYNLTVQMSWTCENEGVYALSAWSLLDLDCGSWTCENRMWTKYDVYSNTSILCMPGSVSFPSADVNVLKLE